MANISKRAQKKLAVYLDPTESVEAALLVEPKGTYGVGMIGHAVATNTTTKALNNSAKRSLEEKGGLAATVPSKPFVIVKTNKRILVSVSNGINFSEPSISFDISAIKLTNREKKLLGQRLTFTLEDGTSFVVDAQRGQPVDAFMQ